ncbi:MAG TPA: hypothetical protein ENL32_00875 [Methanomicrobia archaeon]|nr:hypothetical protein [Methanomicrobia archaeon]
MGCSTKYIPELGGNVIIHNKYLETEIEGIYIAGDCSGIGEASTAMLEGKIAGLSAVLSIRENKKVENSREELIKDLENLREGPFGERPRIGKEKLFKVLK